MILHDHSGITLPRTGTGEYKVLRKGEVLGYVRHSVRWSSFWSYRIDEADTWVSIPGTRKDAVDNLLSARSPRASWLT